MKPTKRPMLQSLLVVFFILCGFPSLQAGEKAGRLSFEIIVHAPPETPQGSTVCVVGNSEALGKWSENGLKLSPGPNGRWQGSFQGIPGTLLEFKVSRGTWKSVEKGRNGEEIPNRRVTLERGIPVEVTVARWADFVQANPTHTGDIRAHPGFHSKVLGNQRDIWVYLPPAYEKEKGSRYPVLYLHDGQNLFNAKSSFGGVEWGVDEKAESLIRHGKIQPIIIVGVGNTPDRMNEYTPIRSEEEKVGGKGADYLRFLTEELKPFIDKTYRTLPGPGQTAIGGSSLGGLISLFAIGGHPKIYGKCVAISPSIWWEKTWILDFMKHHASAYSEKTFWLDMGTREGNGPESHSRNLGNLRKTKTVLLETAHVQGKDLGYLEAEGATHSEASWAARFDRILIHLFPALKERN